MANKLETTYLLDKNGNIRFSRGPSESTPYIKIINEDFHDIIFKPPPLYKLNPFLDDSVVLRVGGRIRNAGLDFNVTHPIVLQKQGHITCLIARHFHEAVHQQGRGFTTN